MLNKLNLSPTILIRLLVIHLKKSSLDKATKVADIIAYNCNMSDRHIAARTVVDFFIAESKNDQSPCSYNYYYTAKKILAIFKEKLSYDELQTFLASMINLRTEYINHCDEDASGLLENIYEIIDEFNDYGKKSEWADKILAWYLTDWSANIKKEFDSYNNFQATLEEKKATMDGPAFLEWESNALPFHQYECEGRFRRPVNDQLIAAVNLAKVSENMAKHLEKIMTIYLDNSWLNDNGFSIFTLERAYEILDKLKNNISDNNWKNEWLNKIIQEVMDKKTSHSDNFAIKIIQESWLSEGHRESLLQQMTVKAIECGDLDRATDIAKHLPAEKAKIWLEIL